MKKISSSKAILLGVKYDISFDNADIKVWNGKNWIWATVPIKSKRNRHLLEHSKQLSPQLIVKNKKVYLSVPFNLKPEKIEGNKCDFNHKMTAPNLKRIEVFLRHAFFNF